MKTFLVALVLTNLVPAFSQLSSDTLDAVKDSYTTTSDPRANYGSLGTFMSGTTFIPGPRGLSAQYHHRGFVEFNLGSIDPSAIIYSAELQLNVSGSVTGSFSWIVSRVTEAWIESTITADDEPGISVLSNDKTTTIATTSSLQKIDVTEMVQRMVAGSSANNGWSIQVDDELATSNTGCTFYSRNYGTASLRPKLIVKYYMPHELLNVVVTHETGSGESDGGIDLDIINGTQDFNWMWVDASGSVIGTDTLVRDLEAGWYGLHLQGNSNPNEHFYYSFIVGQRGSAIDVNIKPNENYTHMAKVSNQVQGDVDYGDVNYGNYNEFVADRKKVGSVLHSEMSLMKFNLWLDKDLILDNADLYLVGKSHSGSFNDAELNLVTGAWNEKTVTYNQMPSTSSSIEENINGIFTSTQSSDVDVSEFWNYWKVNNRKNFGFYFKLVSDLYESRQLYYSPNESTEELRPEFQFTVRVSPHYSSVAWDPDAGKGDITIDVSGESSFSGPYLYMISRDTLPESDSLLNLHLSVTTGGTSASFNNRYVSSASYVFEDYPSGQYFVSVFDQSLGRIFQERVTVQDPLVLDESTGLKVLTNDRIGVVGDSGYGELSLLTHDGINAGIVYSVDHMEGEQFFGFSSMSVTVEDYTDLYYGFRIVDGSINVVKSGSIGTALGSISETDQIEIWDNEGILSIMINGVQQDTYSAPSSYEYKVGMGLERKMNVTIIPIRINSPIRKPYRFKKSVLQEFSCDGDNGSFEFTVTNPRDPSETCSFNYNVFDNNGTLVISGSGTAGTFELIDQNSSGDPLISGEFTVSGTMTCSSGSISFSEQILLGYEVEWASLVDYDNNLVSKELERDAISINPLQVYAYGRSSNYIKPTESGIIEFSLNTVSSTDNAMHYFRFTAGPSTVQPEDIEILEDDFIRVITYNGVRYLEVYQEGQGFLQPFVQLNPFSRIRIELTTDVSNQPEDIIISVDGVTHFQFPRNSATGILRPNTLQLGDAFIDVVATFGCPEPQVQYAHLNWEMDGYYHVMKEGKIRFVYDQEYDTDDLTFNIYNYHDELVKTQADFPTVVTTHGKNYITLDVSEDESCIGRGMFYMEVISSKKEKLYLRYFNDFTHPNCIDYYAEPSGSTD